MNITLTVDFSGSPDQDDILAARHIIFSENQRITAENVARAAQVPPLAPLPLFAFATGAQLRTSYLSILAAILTTKHQEFIAHAKSASGLQSRFTEAQLEQIRINLTTRLNAGEAAAAIVTDTAG